MSHPRTFTVRQSSDRQLETVALDIPDLLDENEPEHLTFARETIRKTNEARLNSRREKTKAQETLLQEKSIPTNVAS